PNLAPYRGPFKSSIVWLSAYATADTGSLTGKGPKQFSMPSWGKIGNIGGEQIIPTSEEKIAVPAGVFDTVLVTWKTGGKLNRVWVVDEFPFPVKADTYAHVAEGVPPQEYRFELLDYQQNVKTNPFTTVKSTEEAQAALNCPTNTDEFVSLTKGTNTNSMIINVKYAPPKPKQGCNMSVIIDFKRMVNQEEFENEIHYDVLVVEQTAAGLEPKRSLADEEKRNALFTTSGQVRRDILIKESGITKYAIFVFGTGPETASPNPAKAGYITFDVDVQPGNGATTTPPQPIPSEIKIPSWVKNNAGWWADGTIGDNDFVQGLQYLINQKIIKIPPTSAGTGGGSNVIPDWIKRNAGWWADGTIGDKDFVSGIQYLITNGIIKLKS
ncbi:MAG TPA: peptidase, partial [Candidatus Nitrosotenuis sp.]|nr:peptidase [Candidatus Nitrosotenuis sp.]